MLVTRKPKDNTVEGVGARYGLLTSSGVEWFNEVSSNISSRDLLKVTLAEKVICFYIKEVDQLIVYEKDEELFRVYHGSLLPEVGYLVDTASRGGIVAGYRLAFDGISYQNILESLSIMTDLGFPALNPSNLAVYLNGVRQSDEEVDSRLLQLWVKHTILKVEKEN